MAPDISVSSTNLPARKKISVQLPVREVKMDLLAKYFVDYVKTYLVPAIIKVNGTNELLDGYNPLVWTSNYQFKWFATTDSYEKRIRSDDTYCLLIDEFEVFQVLKD
ncbi:hypothetical protein C2G38_2174835 [Gigaspora rosea]|uniref:Uncharacterized protein n=1 Tax=Gigaspora rosea TaxID=44941 RepID=A0A397VHY6_9GLOM|nr:hypothetical protein C2G38_2174835 [Gigaspora rosea]